MAFVDVGLGQEDMEEEEEVEELKTAGKVGTKKLRKLQEKAERKAQREVGVALYTPCCTGKGIVQLLLGYQNCICVHFFLSKSKHFEKNGRDVKQLWRRRAKGRLRERDC